MSEGKRPMQIAGAMGAVMVVATVVYMLLGAMGAIRSTGAVNASQRLSEVAQTAASEVASAAVSSGTTPVADSYTESDTRLGTVTVVITVSGTTVTASASAPGLSARTAEATAQ